MKVRFLNQQDNFKVTHKIKKLIKTSAKTSIDYMGFSKKVEISVVLTDNQGIKELNRLHRDIDRATDVLSFPMFEYDENGNIIEDFAEYSRMGNMLLGDIVISLERAKEQSVEYGHSFEREIGFLAVHSMLHLLGYDHMESRDEEEMFGYQREILERMGLFR